MSSPSEPSIVDPSTASSSSSSTKDGSDSPASSATSVSDKKPRTRIFVVGLGMVGIAFIEKILSQDTEGRYQIITCGEEKHLAYNRVGLTEWMQHRSMDEMFLVSPSWYKEQSPDVFQFYVDETVTHIDTEAKVVRSTRTTYEYDICVIATGSDAGMPPYCTTERGRRTKGVFVYRNVSDLEKIVAYSQKPEVTRATVVGGGLLGLEAAKAVYDLDDIKDVSIINRQKFPLSRQLDDEAGELVMRRIEDMGVKCMTRIDVKEMLVRPDPEDSEKEIFTGFEFNDGECMEADLVIMAVGITPRDELARVSGIQTHKRGGIAVDDGLMTSAKDVYAMGECASWRGNTYGLIGPGIEMASILAFNLCQTETNVGTFRPRKMNAPDLSTKLKLMGVDVASFGDFFADRGMAISKPLVDTVRNLGKPDHPNSQTLEGNHVPGEQPVPQTDVEPPVKPVLNERKVKTYTPMAAEAIKCLTYKDPFGGTYKKYIFSGDGKHLLGGMMVGDVSDFVKLVAIIKKKKAIDIPPSQFIIGAKASGEDEGADLDDDAQICSCHNVDKGAVVKCVKAGVDTIGDIKKQTKAGTGCGGCMALVTNIFNTEMKKSGKTVSNDICIHFKHSRADLFQIVKIKKLDNFIAIMEAAGVDKESVGCEICKPVIGSIISSTAGINKHVMDPIHHANQETNDRFMANIQRDGTFSVVPRMAAGEVTPDKLIALGEVAKKYNLYSKVTGGQRIDLFGARKQDLPDIWEMLVNAGFESGHAYGKSLRTVKSCVGTTWCRYGVGDSVGLAVQLEDRYKGVRSPHKFKGGISGCVRECAEAQGKDFGLIATDKGWNLYIGGNGGVTPRHATLFASDIPPNQVVRIVDRYLMFYIQTADKLQRTSKWVDSFEGGISKLRKILLDDELGICSQLEKDMDALVGTYECEWTRVVNEPKRRKMFRQHVNTESSTRNIELITERNQVRAADWPKDFKPEQMTDALIPTERANWEWVKVAHEDDLMPTDSEGQIIEAATSCSVKIGDSQIAIFNVPKRGIFATQQMCPHKRAFVLDHGIVGETKDKEVYISCPLHKRGYALGGPKAGACLTDPDYSIITFEAKIEQSEIYLRLPPVADLDEAIGTSKWMVKKATADLLGRPAATAIMDKSLQLVGPKDEINTTGASKEGVSPAGAVPAGGGGCGNSKLDW